MTESNPLIKVASDFAWSAVEVDKASNRLTDSQRTEMRKGARGSLSSPTALGGVVHQLPEDLRRALMGNPTALDVWRDITPLARNEFICRIEDAKQDLTRARRIRRTQEELEQGQRRPCCWPGCKHRDRTRRQESPGDRSPSDP